MISPENLKSNLDKIQKEVRNVNIIPVTKTHPPELYEICAKAGITHVAENKVQEIRDKRGMAEKWNLKSHLIGPLQSNKIKYLPHLLYSFDSLQNIEYVSLLAEKIQAANAPTMQILIQINSTGESQKSGVPITEEKLLNQFIEKIKQYSNLDFKGFMTMGPTPAGLYDMGDRNYEKDTQQAFRKTRTLFEKFCVEYQIDSPRLSMGMSHDFRLAVQEGATEIRIGSILFGERTSG